MPKRTIIPHKGNRDQRLEVRLSQTTLDQIAAIVAARTAAGGGKRYSIPDWITEKAAEEMQFITSPERNKE